MDGVVAQPDAQAMPRGDLLEWLTQTGEDPRGHSYHSGFWATVTLPGHAQPGTIKVDARVSVGGVSHAVALGEVPVVSADELVPARGAAITVFMASYEPDPELFTVQIQSLRAQSDTDWICVISDGGSSEQTLARMRQTLGEDPRFILDPAGRRLAPYDNFERALSLAPADATLLASCDQDDRWYPEKLATLRAAIGDAALVFCDQRLVAPDGRVLRDSMWRSRRRDHANIVSLLVANSVPGAAMLMRRDVASAALPFPPAPGVPYHDHWLALVALAGGRIAYVDEPLYDYVQHGAAVMGGVHDAGVGTARPSRLGRGPRGWRSAYYGGYVPRAVFAQTLLARCGRSLTRRKRLGLRLFLAAQHDPLAFAWLTARPLRRFIGRDETLSGGAGLSAGLAWRWLLPVAASERRSGIGAPDARFPDPPEFEQRRLRRWRAVG